MKGERMHSTLAEIAHVCTGFDPPVHIEPLPVTLQATIAEIVTNPGTDGAALNQFFENNKCGIITAIRPDDDRLPNCRLLEGGAFTPTRCWVPAIARSSRPIRR